MFVKKSKDFIGAKGKLTCPSSLNSQVRLSVKSSQTDFKAQYLYAKSISQRSAESRVFYPSIPLTGLGDLHVMTAPFGEAK